MIVSWALGDSFKVVYFLVSDAPSQFLYCGLFQITTDIYILAQIYVVYAPNSEPMALLSGGGSLKAKLQ